VQSGTLDRKAHIALCCDMVKWFLAMDAGVSLRAGEEVQIHLTYSIEGCLCHGVMRWA
jgi:hypothetical protein